MMTTGIDELPEFVEHFRLYGFDGMMRALGKYSEVLFYEFYAIFKGELMRQYLQGMLSLVGDPISSLMI